MLAEPFRARRPFLWEDGDYELAHADFKKQFNHSFECDYCHYHSSIVSHVIHNVSGKKTVLCREHFYWMLEAIQCAGDTHGVKVTKRRTRRNIEDVPTYEWDTVNKTWYEVNKKS